MPGATPRSGPTRGTGAAGFDSDTDEFVPRIRSTNERSESRLGMRTPSPLWLATGSPEVIARAAEGARPGSSLWRGAPARARPSGCSPPPCPALALAGSSPPPPTHRQPGPVDPRSPRPGGRRLHPAVPDPRNTIAAGWRLDRRARRRLIEQGWTAGFRDLSDVIQPKRTPRALTPAASPTPASSPSTASIDVPVETRAEPARYSCVTTIRRRGSYGTPPRSAPKSARRIFRGKSGPPKDSP